MESQRKMVWPSCFSFLIYVSVLLRISRTASGQVPRALVEDIAKSLGSVRPAEPARDLSDPSVIFNLAVLQLYHAQTTELFPTPFFLRTYPSVDFYRLRSCSRQDIGTCMLYGNATNGLPKRLQGIWWQDGVALPEQAISTAGIWDPMLRKLTLTTFHPRVWAIHNTNSTRGLFGTPLWFPSGAAHYNSIVSGPVFLDIFFNEDITLGQIVTRVPLLWPTNIITLPSSLLNWTMSLEADGSWLRESSIFGINSTIGYYRLRQAIDGEGKPGPYFNGWLNDQGGQPFLYGEKVFPS